MPIKDRINRESKILDVKNFGQIRDAVISALQEFSDGFFEEFNTKITIEGKLNENGVVIVFNVDSENIKNAKIDESRNIITRLKDAVVKRLQSLKERLDDTKTVEEISISFGIGISMLTRNVVTITMTNAN